MSMMRTNQRGVTVLLVLGFMGIFLFLLGTIMSYILTQGRYGRAVYAREQAIAIAESGLEYYRWFLAHNPEVMETGVGFQSPFTYVVEDPEGGEVGEAVITATPQTACGVVQWVDLTSEGRANSNPIYPRTISARYMKPSVAEYSNIINASVWAGSDRTISGNYHSNGGVRMDGTNNSLVSSATESWVCDSSFGCSPSQVRDGVFGSGSGSALWQYPVSSFDFAGIATEFSDMRGYAQADGILLSGTRVEVRGVQQGNSFPSVTGTDQRGFYLEFNADNTVDVHRVMGTGSSRSQHIDNLGQWVSDYHSINNGPRIGTFAIPDDCPLIYSDAKLWIEGTVGKKVTVVAADIGSFSPDIIINGNITYAAGDGTSGLTAIAERSILIPLFSPQDLTIRGIFVAQNGYVGRNYYQSSGQNGVGQGGAPFVRRSSLTTIGSVVSNLRIGTQWTCGGVFCSGYAVRNDLYDRLLAFSPPPFTPAASPDFRLVLWGED